MITFKVWYCRQKVFTEDRKRPSIEIRFDRQNTTTHTPIALTKREKADKKRGKIKNKNKRETRIGEQRTASETQRAVLVNPGALLG